MELSKTFKSERMAELYALELSDTYRDLFFYVFKRNDGMYLVDPLGIRYSDETLLFTYHKTEKMESNSINVKN